MDDEATQPTQNVLDPRRFGRNNSGLSDTDVSDVICILHPCSLGALKIVSRTAERSPQHVLQNYSFVNFDDGVSTSVLEEQETFIIDAGGDLDSPQAYDLALRFSSRTVKPNLGFVFGRNSSVCDIVIDTDTVKRVSNIHFRIFINDSGVLMLSDMSTNGTLVDDVHLRAKNTLSPRTRMLNAGAVIQILSPKPEEVIKFILRVPTREGHLDEYTARFQSYMGLVQQAEADEAALRNGQKQAGQGAVARPATGFNSSIKPPLPPNTHGMHWNGGDKYHVSGHLGKGAFAIVYLLTTKSDGQYFAAKELEKRRFMKNGVLDRKLDNEMQIMKGISHPNIVQYLDYHDVDNYLYIIMEYVPCGDLQGLLQTRGPLHEELAKITAEQVLDALAYLHKQRITHRDIKPDNILMANISSVESWQVKLSDFGLSKVVKDSETFLKTFCGTLLYCAPEVFPHYDNHVANKAKKRPRRSNGDQYKFHSYSQSVDVWSFGAVLWFALCNSPPFEGVADNTGRGMFDKIMTTPLDPTALMEKCVSDDAIALLVDMLNTDPSERPLPSACLRYSWFSDRGRTQTATELDELELQAIEEEEDAESGAELDVSHLSIRDSSAQAVPEDSPEVNLSSSDFDFLDPRLSKRFKYDASVLRHQPAVSESGRESSYQAFTRAQHTQVNTKEPARTGQPRLFGEIGASAFVSSGLLDSRTNHALSITQQLEHDTSASYGSSIVGGQEPFATAEGQQPNERSFSQHQPASQQRFVRAIPVADGEGAIASPSLLGAESLVRDLNMESPESSNSPAGELSEPTTPRTSEDTRNSSIGQADGANEETPSKPDEVTPRQPIFSRQINMPVSASYFFDPSDPSTHTLEYASKISGLDFSTNPTLLTSGKGILSLPGTMDPSDTMPDPPKDPSIEYPSLASPPEFLRPPPRLGRLVSTQDSFAQITLNINTRVTTWGRDPVNTIVHPQIKETRVPKRGIVLHFLAPGIDTAERTEADWLKLDGLFTIISTESSGGIWVNGIKLAKEVEEGAGKRKPFGRVYTGDVVEVWNGKGTRLAFVCEFFHGEAQKGREDGGARFKVERSGMGP
ncbi:Protein kinase protein rad53 [Elasticomyces elasticus]|nr:Protein kinase protein rad53 [Elasticomyces elasticus]